LRRQLHHYFEKFPSRVRPKAFYAGATPLGFEPRITHQTPVEALSRGKITFSCFAFSDDYSFGILQSGIHWSWFIATCSKLKGDFRYTPESVFDTFPWPQKPKHEDIKAVAEAAVTLRALRQADDEEVELLAAAASYFSSRVFCLA
jgi:hypothetical protein